MPQKEKAVDPTQGAKPAGGKSLDKILLVDDDEDIRMTLGRRLKASGFEVETAEDGLEALEKVKRFNPNLILLDTVMPRMDGYAVCAELQRNAETSDIPVIFVTALGQEQDKAKAFSLGALDYLSKPLEEEVLLAKVNSSLKMASRWKKLSDTEMSAGMLKSDFGQFKEFLAERLNLDSDKQARLATLSPFNIYTIAAELGVLSSRMAQMIAVFLKLEYLPVIKPEDLQMGVLPTAFCKSNLVVAIGDEDTSQTVLVLSNPFNWELIDVLKRSSSLEQVTRLAITEPENIDALLQRASPLTIKRVTGISGMSMDEEHENVDMLIASAKEVSIIQMANNLIARAIQVGASDIHIEPREDAVGIRFRVDGMLHEQESASKRLQGPLISRFKIIANMNIAERRIPQDGRTRVFWNHHSLDLRLSALPTIYGEKMVIRILDKMAVPLELTSLGFEEKPLENLKKALAKPHGIILVTGPTGSGKTTTLYAALQLLNKPKTNIVTVEDPVEYDLRMINQVQIRPEAGLTFPLALRSILRQDPNVILVGEIRDAETLDIAIKASLTGHLVLSTVHTNDSATTPLRLIDMGMEPFLVASSLELIGAQRLVRKLCPWCKKRIAVPEELLTRYREHLNPGTDYYQAAGCDYCNQSGYKGRQAVIEVMPIDDEMRRLITASAPAVDLQKYAMANLEMRTLRQDGFTKAERGMTSLEEVLRVTG